MTYDAVSIKIEAANLPIFLKFECTFLTKVLGIYLCSFKKSF